MNKYLLLFIGLIIMSCSSSKKSTSEPMLGVQGKSIENSQQEFGKSKKATSIGLFAQGDKENWTLRIIGEQLIYKESRKDSFIFAFTGIERIGNRWVINCENNSRSLALYLSDNKCDDSRNKASSQMECLLNYGFESMNGCAEVFFNPALIDIWTLENKKLDSENTPQMDLSSERNISGKAVCNSFGGKWIAMGQNIYFSPIFRTEMFCASNSEIEDHFFTTLHESVRYQLKDGHLILYSEKDQLNFMKID